MSEMKTLTLNGQTYTLRDSSAARAILCQAQGSAITVGDSAEAPLEGLTLYGRTVQNGTPAPESPVPLESVGDSGNIGLTVSGKNLLRLPAFSKTHYGVVVTIDAEAQTISLKGTLSSSGEGAKTCNIKLETPVFVPGGKTVGMFAVPHAAALPSLYVTTAENSYASENITSTYGSGGFYAKAFAEGKVLTQLRIYMAYGADYDVTFKVQLSFDTTEPQYEIAPMPQTLSVSTPGGLPGIPVPSGGNYTDENGQAWVCDEVDLARGVHVHRLLQHIVSGTDTVYDHSNGNIYLDVGQALKTGTGVKSMCSVSGFYTGGGGVYFLPQTGFYSNAEEFKAYAQSHSVELLLMLAEPVETPLSAEELAAYAAMHSNYPNTTVTNDAGADMALSYVADTKAYIDNKLAALT